MSYGDDIIKEGINKGIIKIEKNKVTYPNGRSYNFQDKEEKVRARVIIELITKYQYPLQRIDTEASLSRDGSKPADIVVYEDDDKQKAYIVVETKASESDAEEAKRQGLGNANALSSKYLMVVCGSEKICYNVEKHPANIELLDEYRIADIPVNYGNAPEFKFKKGDANNDLRKVSLNELNRKFALCHNAIWESGKRDPAVSFDEFSKILNIKIYDERKTPEGEYYNFQIGTNENEQRVANRIKELYKEVKNQNQYIFNKDIELPDSIIYKVCSIIQDISLKDTDLDVKGRAFENFLGELFRGKYGQYFTPRQIVEFMVNVVDPDEKHFLIDPACGSGGFLLYSMMHVINKINKKYSKDQNTITWSIFEFSSKHIFGIEINDRIARVAMMDMIIHEDGHTNIECNNGLASYEKFNPTKGINREQYDIVLANPPFGAQVDDKEILSNFELGRKKGELRKQQKSDVLFIERCLDLLKPGGRMGIVLPDSILTASSLKYVRDFIKQKAKILAVVSLPNHTFRIAGAGVKTSLLFLEKKIDNIEDDNYEFFIANAEHIGYDSTGKPDDNDLPKILEELRSFLSNGKLKGDYKLCRVVNNREVFDNLLPFTNENEEEYRPVEEIWKEIIELEKEASVINDELRKIFKDLGIVL